MKEQRGSGTLLLCGVGVILLVLTWVGAVGGAYAIALHRVRGAADRAALAGAVAYASGYPPCPAARRQVAAEAPAALTGCREVGDLHRYVISAEVQWPVATRVPGMPRSLSAVAHAGSGEASVARAARAAGAAAVPGADRAG
ncbi:Rv3654c family TadE-like protein [Raineyella fluvialis]|uniref:Helicase/secretion neighborhood TadE-like protein n=1 Tax=Raineyella fluvialis TaxID=2662261 RepID=A0A5Q2F841_9ACTN|nr:Rv3654c family TadE-like protein [Raineyella fluvialis]QGF22828.1 hypothetical protein Rai3103_03135 [Raineyella fluvialis]